MTDIDALQKAAREIRGDMSFLNASNGSYITMPIAGES